MGLVWFNEADDGHDGAEKFDNANPKIQRLLLFAVLEIFSNYLPGSPVEFYHSAEIVDLSDGDKKTNSRRRGDGGGDGRRCSIS
ncbi:hypothetical protein RHGRI_001692 [Rhododendron griersonianum]|uniref:Uncharacterized protein n=1 Tax=Rhododendron griersonianum TaxID=479676 RepID=A0AAV6LME6_9ERIC|nr:hypothetical protein RHGRI_001692 [Rhododendron griersonianum]